MRWIVIPLLILATGCVSTDNRTAEIRQCWDLTKAGADPNLRVHECSRAIVSGLLTDEGIAQAYNNRGLAYLALEDADRAFADFNAAIRLDPDNGTPYYNRGLAYGRNLDYDRAIADLSAALKLSPYDSDVDAASDAYDMRAAAYASRGEYELAFADLDQALRLKPSNLEARNSRAFLSIAVGRFAAAADDFATLLAEEPTNHDLALWAYVARERSAQDGLAELRANAARLNIKQWPGPMVRLYLGEIELSRAEQLLRDVGGGDDVAPWCTFHLFSAQWLIIHDGEREKVVDSLGKAAGACPSTSPGHRVVEAELKRLGS